MLTVLFSMETWESQVRPVKDEVTDVAKFYQKCNPRMVKNQSVKRRRIFHGKALWATAVSLALLMGCAVGPEFKPPEAPDTKNFTATALPDQTEAAPVAGGDAQYFKKGERIPRQWWLLFF